jgi:hypothetical protein
MSESKDNIRLLNLPPKDEEITHIKIVYSDGTEEEIEADTFGLSRDVDNFLLFWREDPYKVSFFLNINCVKKVVIVDGPLL